MKKKFLIPIAGVFIMALAFSFNSSSNSENFDVSFIESDNIAFAEVRNCGYKVDWMCITQGKTTYDEQYCY